MNPAPSFTEVADLLHLGMAYQVVSWPDGRREFRSVGQRSRQLLGLEPEEAMADPSRLYERVLPEHRAALARAEELAIASVSRFDIEVRMRGLDDQVCWRRITSTPTPQPDGSVLWNGIVMDVSDARRAAERLEEQRRRLEAAVEATGLGFWEWDVRNDRVTWSERNCEMFGLPPKRTVMTIERYIALIHPDDLPLVQEAYVKTREGGGGDFVVEHRTRHQPGGLTRWVQARGRTVADAEGPALVVGTTLDISERKAVEDRRALLLGELAHRAKNGIQVMMGIVNQTARGVRTVQEFRDVLVARLSALADSQDLVMASGGRPVPLQDVVAKTLSPFGTTRFELDDLGGVTIAGEVAVALALLLHELSTNAVKYGALSQSSGRVALRRGEDAAGDVVLCWEERDGPPVRPAKRKGFGSRLLEVGLSAYGGKVEARFDPAGFTANIHFPVAAPPRP
ncbi:sensor histidine kinase [Phenylobacterium sp. VNQ135]